MAMKSAAVVSASLRSAVFSALDIANIEGFQKINDRQYGILLTDDNGVERYVRVGAIVAEEREDCTARELMEAEVAKYQEAQAKKAAQAAKKAEKIAKDKAKREAEAAKKAAEAEEA